MSEKPVSTRQRALESAEIEVKVIQYLLPDGRRRDELTHISAEFQPHYEAMLAAHCNFGAEILQAGLISLTIEDPENEEDKNIRIVQNGPGVQKAFEEMLAESFPINRAEGQEQK